MDYGNYNTGFETTGLESGGLDALFGGFLMVYLLIMFAVAILIIVAQWKIFSKANKPGWASLVPIYNQYVLLEICGMNPILAFLTLIPFVGSFIALYIAVVSPFKLAGAFGKDTAFGVGLLLVGPIFYPILAFSDATYMSGPSNTGMTPNTPAMNPNPTMPMNNGMPVNNGMPMTDTTPTQTVSAPNPMANNGVHFDPPAGSNNGSNNNPL